MIYTDRKYLSVLMLTEDRDYVTYDELIQVLTERPSDVVYIERDGILCGLLTGGRIERHCDEKARCVPFKKKYTYVRPGEYWRAREIFRDKKIVSALPVVSEDGRLLGDYKQWDDLIGTDYAELLCKDPYVLHSLKENIQDAVFVEPVVGGGAFREKMFSWWRQKLEGEGIQLRVIRHCEIKDYIDAAKYFLFADKNEKRGIEILNQYLCYEETINKWFLGITDYLYRIGQLTNMSFLKELQNQGVFVLTFDFQENDNRFLSVLRKRIWKRNEEYGVDSCKLPEELKESFFDELYCEAYKTQHFPLGMPSHGRFGITYLNDSETKILHIRDGERLTVNQPEEYNHCVYLYGPNVVAGAYVSDQYTISSLLQNKVNQSGYSCRVISRGTYVHGLINSERLQVESIKRGDIVVLDVEGSPVEGLPLLNLTDALEKHDAPADWFMDHLRHCSHKANQVYTYAIYEALIPVLQQPPGERTPVELDRDYINNFYLRHYFSGFDPSSRGTVGSIVMNCNPFTLGQRFLIEEALKTVDFLIVFVVEEDESIFSFQERFAMVCQGTSDLENIMVVPSGPYILSPNTFPEYFQKIEDKNLKKNAKEDITRFAERIAPKLGITYRFVGDEREDKVTNEYNETMKRILPRYGIQVVEIPQKSDSQSEISASRVRQCLSQNRMEELGELIPASTKRILFYEIK